MLSAKDAKNQNFTVDWKNDKELCYAYSKIKESVLDEIERKIKARSIDGYETLAMSLGEYNENLQRFGKHVDVTAKVMQDLSLSICGSLRSAGYAVKNRAPMYILIDWSEA